jgi:dihydroxyacetone kinase phosphotransfer subunit
MIGIVVVSHSRSLAESAIGLAMEMAQSEIQVVNAAGAADGGFGTDASRILSAIDSFSPDDQVAVIVDLGSAVMSSELAIEMAGRSEGSVRILNAPFVEGLLVAVTTASIGQPFDEVIRSAEEALKYPKVKPSPAS